MKIKLLRRYSAYQTGRVLDCDDEISKRLIADGTAEAIETAAIEVAAERADATPIKVKRAVQKPENDNPAGR